MDRAIVIARNAKKYRRNLLLIVKKLRSLKSKKRFYYARWVGANWKGGWRLDCGTSACALGWGTTIPELRRQGLRLSRDGLPRLAASYGWERLNQQLFGLTGVEADYLFMPLHWPVGDYGRQSPRSTATAREVANHIEAFVNKKYPVLGAKQ